jgi:hypothetical protein
MASFSASRDTNQPGLELLWQPGGRAFLNLVERALNDFENVALL